MKQFLFLMRPRIVAACLWNSIPPLSPPQATKKFQLIFDSTGKSGFQQHFVHVNTTKGRAQIKVTARIVNPIRLFPNPISVNCTPTSSITTNILLRFADGYPPPRPEQISLISDGASLRAMLTKSTSHQDSYTIQINIDASSAIKGVRSKHSLTVTDTRNGFAEAAIFDLTYRLPLRIEPNELNLGLISSRHTERQTMTVRAREGFDMTNITARATVDWLDIFVEPLEQAAWNIHVSPNKLLSNNASPESVFIEILTESPQLPMWRVPVICSVLSTNTEACCR